MIKAVETVYNGYRFRSRLEARWAVFFDALGVKYEYEPQGFELPSGKLYLPDFKVKCWGTRGVIREEPFDLWIEVKGYMTREDSERIKEFANANWPDWSEVEHLPESEKHDAYDRLYRAAEKDIHRVLVVANIPNKGSSSDSYDLGAYECMDEGSICPFNYELIDGDCFGAYPAASKGKFFLWGDDSNYIWNQDEVERAYDLARQARFEHGERPIM